MPIRIIHIGKFYPPFAGGIENFMGDLLPALQKIGCDVTAIVHEHLSATTQRTLPPVCRVSCYGSLMYAPISPSFPLVLSQVIRNFRPDILHLHLPNTSAFWVMTIPRARRIPWVIHWHADVVSSKIDRRLSAAYRFYQPFEKRILKHARAVIATSRPYLETSPALTPWKKKCRVVPLGADPTRLKPPDPKLEKWAEKIWGMGKTKILAIGRLTYYKGHEVLIKAVTDIPDIKVVIAGKGDHRTRLQNLITASGVREKVRLSGFLEDSELHALLATCDSLCLPSVERTEAFGLVLPEAMRFGKPAVAADVRGSGIGRVVRHKETGLLVRPGEPESLAEALKVMAESPELRMRMGRAGRERFEKLFRIEPVAREIMGLYQAVLSGSL